MLLCVIIPISMNTCSDVHFVMAVRADEQMGNLKKDRDDTHIQP